METEIYDLTAGERLYFDTEPLKSFELLETEFPLTLDLVHRQRNGEIERAVDVQEGHGERAENEDEIIYGFGLLSSVNQSVKVGYSIRKLQNNQLKGSIQVENTVGAIQASKTQSSQMQVFAGGVSQVGAALYFENKHSSDVYITKLRVGIKSTAGGLAAIKYVNAFTAAVTGGNAIRDLSNYDDGAELGRISNTASTDASSNIRNIDSYLIAAAGVVEQEYFSENQPIKIPAGGGFLVNGSAGVVDEISLYVEGQTEVPQSFSGAAAQNAVTVGELDGKFGFSYGYEQGLYGALADDKGGTVIGVIQTFDAALVLRIAQSSPITSVEYEGLVFVLSSADLVSPIDINGTMFNNYRFDNVVSLGLDMSGSVGADLPIKFI